MFGLKEVKIVNFHNCCEDWKPGRNAKGELQTDKACWNCYFNLFAHCWLESKGNKTVALALEDVEMAKQELHKHIERRLR